MNSSYTSISDYYKNQNNYIPTRYYCEAYAGAVGSSMIELVRKSDGKIEVKAASEITSSEPIIDYTKDKFENQYITIIADKLPDIKGFHIFTTKDGIQFTPNIMSMSGNPGIFVTKNEGEPQKIEIGRSKASLYVALGSPNVDKKFQNSDFTFARIYIIY